MSEVSPDKAVGIAIQDIRVNKGYSQARFAEALRERGINWSQGTLSRVELGDRPVRLVEAVVVAEILDVSLPTLLREGIPTEVRVREAHQGFLDAVIGIRQAVAWMAARATDAEEILAVAPEAGRGLDTKERPGPKDADDYRRWLLDSLQDLAFPDAPHLEESSEEGAEVLAIADFAVANSVGRFTGPGDDDWELVRKPKVPKRQSGEASGE